jgi:hypothetical protein
LYFKVDDAIQFSKSSNDIKMKKLYLVLLILLPVMGVAQDMQDEVEEYQAGAVFIGFGSGADYHINAFRSLETSDFRFYEKNPRYHIGLDLGVMATKRFRPRLEIKYIRLAYGQEWLGWEDISYTTMKTTTTKGNYLGLNLHLDYLILGKDSKLKVFLSPGLKTEYALGAGYKTKKTDGDTTTDHYSKLDDYYPSCIAGLAVSGIFKYELNQYLGLTFTPEYTNFFRPFQQVNDNKYQRLSFNVGLEIHIY